MEKVSRRIKDFNKDRVPDMLQLKYKAMAENLYRFYRGTNHLFYEDLLLTGSLPPSPLTWVCGDLHLENFGSFKSDNRLVYFDLNDFDEAMLGPAAFELVRMLTSIFIAFESLQIEQKKALNMSQLFLRSYAATLSAGKSFYIEPKIAKGIVCDFLNAVSGRKYKDILRKKAIQVKDGWQLVVDNTKHFKLSSQQKRSLHDHITKWLKHDGNSPYNYNMEDAVLRQAGTGSLGLKRYAILLKTLNDTGEKYILIDMKQASASSLKPFIKIPQPKWESEAYRIISVQQRMQNRPPALLSACVFGGEAYVIKEMQPTKDSINFKLLEKDYRSMCQVIDDMGMLTASSQLRSSGRQKSATADELIKFGNSGNWEAILKYAIEYSHQVKRDYLHFLNDYKKGEFKK